MKTEDHLDPKKPNFLTVEEKRRFLRDYASVTADDVFDENGKLTERASRLVEEITFTKEPNKVRRIISVKLANGVVAHAPV